MAAARKKPASTKKKPAAATKKKPAAAKKKPDAVTKPKPAAAAAKKKPTPVAASARTRGVSVDDYVLSARSPQREVLDALRGTIKAAAPGVTESIKWGQPVFESNGPMIFLKAATRHVTFGFWRGAELEQQGFAELDGDGTRMRHLKVADLDQLDRALATRLIQAAVALNASKGDPTRRR